MPTFCQLFFQICNKYLHRHVKIDLTIEFCLSKIEISWKLAKKSELLKEFGSNLGFILKRVPRICNPWISWLLFGTQNHEMRGPPVIPVLGLAKSSKRQTKGQLISEWIFMSSIFQKKPNNPNLMEFCPENLKSGLIKSKGALYYVK